MNTAIIHAKLSRSVQFLRLSDQAALLLLMALPHCDDYGRITADPETWSITVCPGRFNLRQTESLIGKILANRDSHGLALLTRYEVNGEAFLFVTKWFEYQGIGSNYMARATCPHPVLGILEPNVMGKTLKGAGLDMVGYNGLNGELSEFLESGRQDSKHSENRNDETQESAKNAGKSAKIETKSAQIDGESSEHLRRSGANLPKNKANLPKKGPSHSHSHSKALIPEETTTQDLTGRQPEPDFAQALSPGTGTGPPMAGNLALDPGPAAMLDVVLGKGNPAQVRDMMAIPRDELTRADQEAWNVAKRLALEEDQAAARRLGISISAYRDERCREGSMILAAYLRMRTEDVLGRRR